jgi:hypothetical protein
MVEYQTNCFHHLERIDESRITKGFIKIYLKEEEVVCYIKDVRTNYSSLVIHVLVFGRGADYDDD